MAARRNPSKDSVLSSNSSTTNNSQADSRRNEIPKNHHSYKSSRDLAVSTSVDTGSSSSTSTDPATLIKAANGSPEAVINKLLREKQAITQRNEQLWRLVEKQRSMILELNADLEKIATDKERYKRKLKEKEQSTIPQAPSVGTIAAQTATAGLLYPNQSAIRETPNVTSEQSKSSTEFNSKTASRDISTPGNPPFLHSVQSPGGSLQKDRTSQSPPARIFRLEEPPKQSPASDGPLQDGKRKTTPAHLDLSRPNATAPSSQELFGKEDESEFENDEPDNLAPKFSPVERGRLRSREDDDRQREAIVRMEEEKDTRSRSTKSKSNKSGSKSRAKALVPETGVQNTVRDANLPADFLPGVVGLPTSPRSNLLGALQSPMQPTSVTSISAALKSQLYSGNTADTKQRLLNPLKSPGLPSTPRPGDRSMGAALPKAPNTPSLFSPRSGFPLSPRAPRQPIPLLRKDGGGFQSPHLARADTHKQTQESSLVERLQSAAPEITRGNEIPVLTRADSTENGEVYKGFLSEQYPNLLLPPNALPLINVKVFSSRLLPSRNSYTPSKPGEDSPVFTLAVFSRSDNQQLWRVEKTMLSLPMLDQALRAVSEFSAKLPDRSLFSGHAPAKIDARTEGLNKYFEIMLDTPLDEAGALVVCEFFSTDVIPPKSAKSSLGVESSPTSVSPGSSLPLRKEGYLTKRGKNFGGWKTRFFVLEGSELLYYDSPGASLAGMIKLKNAQIGRQSSGRSEGDLEDQYRHTLLILEPKRKDSTQKIRHILCAESDEERDSWVEALLQRTDQHPDDYDAFVDPGSAKSPKFPTSPSREMKKKAKDTDSPKFESFSYENSIPAGSPKLVTSFKFPNGPSPSPPPTPSKKPSLNGITSIGHPSISSPVSGNFIQNAESWGNKAAKDKEFKKRGIFGFKRHGSSDLQTPKELTSRDDNTTDQRISPRMVFGLPLSEAANYFSPVDVDICLPAVVYRCIEYLEAKGAAREEGIFRLSGSNHVIQELQDRFNAEGDVKLLEDGRYHDINAVAGVLKRYLSALPAPVLTRELHIDFLKVLELEDQLQKLQAFNVLVHRLPEANFELLATLCRFLLDIVNNSQYNKMNVRNIGILFSPTLNIPAPLISLFITDFEALFGAPISPSEASKIIPIIENFQTPQSFKTLSGDDIRSPRKQMFTDLPTPAYNQTTFSGPASSHASNKSASLGPAYGNAFYQQQSYGATTQQVDPRALYDTGFVPQDSKYQQQQQAVQIVTQAPESSNGGFVNFGSLNAALAPSTTSQVPRLTAANTSTATTSVPHTTLPAITGSRKSSSGSASSSSFSFGSVDSKDALTTAAVKKGRRESSLLGPGTQTGLSGQRKSSMQRLKDVAGNLKNSSGDE